MNDDEQRVSVFFDELVLVAERATEDTLYEAHIIGSMLPDDSALDLKVVELAAHCGEHYA